MFGIGASELVLIVIVALIVVGPKNLPITLKAIGRAIGEFRRATRELRNQVGFDDVVDEVTRPLREGMNELRSDVMRMDAESAALSAEYPEGGADDCGALPETANVYADIVPAPRAPEAAVARGRRAPGSPGGGSA